MAKKLPLYTKLSREYARYSTGTYGQSFESDMLHPFHADGCNWIQQPSGVIKGGHGGFSIQKIPAQPPVSAIFQPAIFDCRGRWFRTKSWKPMPGVLEFVAAHWIGCLKTAPGHGFDSGEDGVGRGETLQV